MTASARPAAWAWKRSARLSLSTLRVKDGRSPTSSTEAGNGKGADALEIIASVRPGAAEGQETAKRRSWSPSCSSACSRDVAFISTLMARKIDFVTADDPTKSPFLLHIKAAVAQEERRMISQAQPEALAAAKERVFVLGSAKVAQEQKAAPAAARDAELEPILRKLSHLSSRGAAAELAKRGYVVSYGTVVRMRARLGLGPAGDRAAGTSPGWYVGVDVDQGTGTGDCRLFRCRVRLRVGTGQRCSDGRLLSDGLPAQSLLRSPLCPKKRVASCLHNRLRRAACRALRQADAKRFDDICPSRVWRGSVAADIPCRLDVQTDTRRH